MPRLGIEPPFDLHAGPILGAGDAIWMGAPQHVTLQENAILFGPRLDKFLGGVPVAAGSFAGEVLQSSAQLALLDGWPVSVRGTDTTGESWISGQTGRLVFSTGTTDNDDVQLIMGYDSAQNTGTALVSPKPFKPTKNTILRFAVKFKIDDVSLADVSIGLFGDGTGSAHLTDVFAEAGYEDAVYFRQLAGTDTNLQGCTKVNDAAVVVNDLGSPLADDTYVEVGFVMEGFDLTFYMDGVGVPIGDTLVGSVDGAFIAPCLAVQVASAAKRTMTVSKLWAGQFGGF